MGAELEPDGGAELYRSRVRRGDGEQQHLRPGIVVSSRKLESEFGDAGEHLSHDPGLVLVVDHDKLARTDLFGESVYGAL
jgi:hypothetical protein